MSAPAAVPPAVDTTTAVSNKDSPTYTASFNKWSRVMHSLLDQLSNMYKGEDKEINVMLELFDLRVMSKKDNDRRDAALLWHSSMSAQYEPVKDVARQRGLDPKTLGEPESKVADMDELAKAELAVMGAVASHPFMEPLALVKRYHELDEASKDSLWLHVYRLNTHAHATQEAMVASGSDMAAAATEEYMASMPPQWRERFIRASSQFGGQMPKDMAGWQKGLGAAFEGASGDDMLALFNAATSKFTETGGMAGMQSMLSAAAAQAGPQGAKIAETMGDMGKVMTGLMSTMGGMAPGGAPSSGAPTVDGAGAAPPAAPAPSAGAGVPAGTSEAPPMMTPASEV